MPPWLIAVAAALFVATAAFAYSQYERAEAAGTKLAAAEGVIKSHEEDRKKNEKAVQQLAQKLQDTETKVVTVTEKVYAAPITRDCAKSPAMRAASDGMRSLFSSGSPDGGPKSAPAVPRPPTRP